MQITALIKELLYQYECVTIPQFGAFLTRAFEAKVDPSGLFFPSRKEVYFNQLLIANDGVLAKLHKKRSGRFRCLPLKSPWGEATSYGWQILPDTCGGRGPMYFSKIQREL